MARVRTTDSTAVLTVSAIVVSFWFAEQSQWLQITSTVGVVVTGVGVWLLFSRRTTCKVANRSRPYPCQNPVRGMFVACHLPDHRTRKRKLIWARLRGRGPVAGGPALAPPPPARRPSSRRPTAIRSEPVTADNNAYWLDGATVHVTVLVCTILGGIGGIAGVVSTVHAITTSSS